MWRHPQNDQRPAVIDWLQNVVPAGRDVADIGAGDGYYIDSLHPARYSFVEPIRALRARSAERARMAGVQTRPFRSVDTLRRAPVWQRCNCVVLIHSLLYLTQQDLRAVAALATRTLAVFVYPDPRGAETIAFEDSIGEDQSRRLVALKETLLGPPTARVEVAAHFRLSRIVSDDEIAFLLSHTLQRQRWRSGIARAALRYVRSRRASWYRDEEGWTLPQPQVMEAWLR